MKEIRHQVQGASDEVESAEIYLPDDTKEGSGEFTMTLKPSALGSSKVFWSTVIHPPKLQILATVDARMNVTVKLGLKEIVDQKTFRIPMPADPAQKHNVRINFSKWKLTDAYLDDKRIEPVT